MTNPLVTVNILSFNRKEELRHTLTKVFEQDYKNIEVVVVDNASSDGTQQMVKTEFPNVNLIELNENIGIAGWNKGFEAAKGEYVLVLDDDSYPENETIVAGVNSLNTNKKAVIVGFAIYNSFFDLIENYYEYNISNSNAIETSGFVGCGALIRKDEFLTLGGFEESIFLYFNELEFSIRARSVGLIILFDPLRKVVHTYYNKKRGERDSKLLYINERRFKHMFISYLIFLYLHFSLYYLIKYSLKLVVSKFYIACKLGFLRTYFSILFSIPNFLFRLRNKRNPVSNNIQREYNFGNLRFRDLYVYYPS